jgi:hypothetical protein
MRSVAFVEINMPRHSMMMAALASMACMGLAAPAVAQSASATVQAPQPDVRLQTVPQMQAQAPAYEGPSFTVLGVPTHLSAPVSPPYAAAAYDDLGGQPQTGADVIMAQTHQDQVLDWHYNQ